MAHCFIFLHEIFEPLRRSERLCCQRAAAVSTTRWFSHWSVSWWTPLAVRVPCLVLQVRCSAQQVSLRPVLNSVFRIDVEAAWTRASSALYRAPAAKRFPEVEKPVRKEKARYILNKNFRHSICIIWEQKFALVSSAIRAFRSGFESFLRTFVSPPQMKSEEKFWTFEVKIF